MKLFLKQIMAVIAFVLFSTIASSGGALNDAKKLEQWIADNQHQKGSKTFNTVYEGYIESLATWINANVGQKGSKQWNKIVKKFKQALKVKEEIKSEEIYNYLVREGYLGLNPISKEERLEQRLELMEERLEQMEDCLIFKLFCN